MEGHDAKRYAACNAHLAEAMDFMGSNTIVRLVKVTGHSRDAGSSTYTCDCKVPADWMLVEQLNVRGTESLVQDLAGNVRLIECKGSSHEH